MQVVIESCIELHRNWIPWPGTARFAPRAFPSTLWLTPLPVSNNSQEAFGLTFRTSAAVIVPFVAL